MQIGRNTLDGRELMGFVERVEEKRKKKKQLGDEEKVIKAEAQARGFIPGGIDYLVRMRAMKPSKFREHQDIADLYLHAAGLANEPPLFKFIESMGHDALGKAEVVERMKDIVPIGGSITVEIGEGLPIKIARAKDGTVTTSEVQPPAPKALGGGSPRTVEPAPSSVELPPEISDATPDGAEQLGRDAAQGNRPIIDNPYPFGDERRARWDRGWRIETGSDGMGPDDEE